VALLDNPVNKKFADDYFKKWKVYPVTDAWGGYTAVTLFLEAVKATNGDTSPAAIKEAMQKITIDTPSGKYKMSAESNGFIGTGDLHIVKSVKIGDRYTWQPVYAYSQVRFSDALKK
jgi:ABC-type branched-subunit amino acid transport system substrate-binding protein